MDNESRLPTGLLRERAVELITHGVVGQKSAEENRYSPPFMCIGHY